MTLPFADWMLVERMGTLYFPDHGIPRIGGAVPVYFMGLWIMLLWQVLWFAQLTKRPYLVTALLSFGGFLFWEWASHPMALWQANDVLKIADFALYPLIPEVLLSLGALFFWRLLKIHRATNKCWRRSHSPFSIPVHWRWPCSGLVNLGDLD